MRYENLKDPGLKAKCSNLFVFIPLHRDKPMILRFPVFLIHRLMLIVLACGLHEHVTLSLQLLLLGDLWHTMYLCNYQEQSERSQQWLSLFTQTGVHMMLLQLFLQTDFVWNPVAQVYFSIVYLVLFGVICVVHITLVVRMNFVSY